MFDKDDLKQAEYDEKVRSIIEELETYASLCDDELGETIYLLINLHKYSSDYIFNTALKLELEHEMELQLENFKNNSTIVEREETWTVPLKELIWDL